MLYLCTRRPSKQVLRTSYCSYYMGDLDNNKSNWTAGLSVFAKIISQAKIWSGIWSHGIVTLLNIGVEGSLYAYFIF